MKKIFILFALLLSTTALVAGPIGEKRAHQIASEFFAKRSTRASSADISLEWAGSSIGETATRASLDDALLYIYNRGEKEGFVVVAGDSNITPIVAYSFNSTLDINNMADATKAILDAWCRQVEAARNGAELIDYITEGTTRAAGELLYDTALWNQGTPFNDEAPIIAGQRAVTGCVATAMAIICKYNEWPTKASGTTPEYSYDKNGTTYTIDANALGRTYDYGNMLMDYNYGYTSTEGKAVAALMKDLGTAVQMMYHPEGSGAFDAYVPRAFGTYFGYAKDCLLMQRGTYTQSEWNELLKQNVAEYGPTYYSGQGDAGGHAFIVDGYDAQNYFHFNFGWGGYGNGYFLTPTIEFYKDQMSLFYLTPDNEGTSTFRDNLLLTDYYYSEDMQFKGITSYATEHRNGEKFYCLLGAVCNYSAMVYTGNVAVMHCDANGEIKEAAAVYSIEELGLGYLVLLGTVDITLDDIVVGDRLRVYYTRQDTGEWEWMRSADRDNAYDELVLKASAEQIAESLVLQYDKSAKQIIFGSPYTLVLNLECDGNSVVSEYGIPANQYTALDVTNYAPCTFTFSFRSGADSYTLKVKL